VLALPAGMKGEMIDILAKRAKEEITIKEVKK
jgi:hypothetical protein